MASINTIVKRKQYLWLGIVVVGTASAIGGALYLSDVDMSGNGEAVAEQEPVPDMTGVVDTTFDDKVRQHATTEMQVTAAQMDSWRSVPFSRISTSTLSCACMAGAVKRAQNRSEEPRIILFMYMALCVIR